MGFLDLEKPHLLQVFYSSQLKSSKAFFHTLPLRLCPCQFGQKRDCYLLVNYHFSFSRLSPASLSVTVALHPIKRNSDDDAEWKQTGRSCASTLAGCTGGHDPALKGSDLSMWTSVMTVSLRPRQAETSDKKPFDPNTAGPDLHLLIPSILTDIHHHCHHCQQSRNGRCVCVCVRVGVRETDRHCGCWLICCVPIFACSEGRKRQEGSVCGLVLALEFTPQRVASESGLTFFRHQRKI